jgi:tRNA1Val (adenine37-N6)-methyltransferase
MEDGLSPRQRARWERVRARWRPPEGPKPVGPGEAPDLIPGAGETLDYLAGDWRIFQRRDGHRYSTDDLLTAWYACHLAHERCLEVRCCLDLGAGIGSVAMMVAWRFPAARVVAIEAQDLSVALMARSLRYNGIASRVEIRKGDLRDSGLYEGTAFELVTGTPPYLAPGRGVVSQRPQCDPCRFERRGAVEAYLSSAARALSGDGICVLVHEWAQLERLRRAASDAGLHLTRVQPVEFREGRPPRIALYAFERSAWEPERVEEPLVIRTRSGSRGQTYCAAREWMGFPP